MAQSKALSCRLVSTPSKFQNKPQQLKSLGNNHFFLFHYLHDQDTCSFISCDLYKKKSLMFIHPNLPHYIHSLSQNHDAIKMVSWLPWKPLSLLSLTIKKSPPKTWLMFSAQLSSYSAVGLLSLHGNRTTKAKINCNPSALSAGISAALKLQPLRLYRSLSMNLKEPLISGLRFMRRSELK